ncbi:MAG: hypothetical protein JWR26_138 [Pedosphaera sp.]|nr:hypothetical protein [Pedosphaera sp.]
MAANPYNDRMIKTRVLNVALFLAIVSGLIVMLWVVLPHLRRSGSNARISDTPTVVRQVQTLSQLVTVKYVMEKVVILDDVQWYKEFVEGFGDSRVLMIAHAVVKAGVDMSKIDPKDVRISEKKIIITLPPAHVTDCYLDDKLTKVVERKTGLLRSFDKDLEQRARQQAVADIDLAARQEGILKDAEERARTQLTNLFHQLGFEEVEFRSP